MLCVCACVRVYRLVTTRPKVTLHKQTVQNEMIQCVCECMGLVTTRPKATLHKQTVQNEMIQCVCMAEVGDVFSALL